MNWKLVSAFSTGAVLASGIVYFAVRMPEVPRQEARRQEAGAPPVAALAPPKPRFETPSPAATPPPVQPQARVRMLVREKPSPMPPPLRQKQEVAIAKSAPAPTPPPEPIPPTPEATQPPPTTPPVPLENVSLPPPPPDPAPVVENSAPHTVTLAAGTMLPVRIGETLSTARNQTGDTFLATLTQPLVIDGFVIAERGARVEGSVVDATPAGKAKGVARLGISVVRLATADGQNLRIRTEPFVKDAASSAGTEAAKIGGGAAIGAIIGAIAGGGKGAAIGAGAGGAIGAGDVLLTRGQAAEIKVETRVSFKVQDSVTITERLD